MCQLNHLTLRRKVDLSLRREGSSSQPNQRKPLPNEEPISINPSEHLLRQTPRVLDWVVLSAAQRSNLQQVRHNKSPRPRGRVEGSQERWHSTVLYKGEQHYWWGVTEAGYHQRWLQFLHSEWCPTDVATVHGDGSKLQKSPYSEGVGEGSNKRGGGRGKRGHSWGWY